MITVESLTKVYNGVKAVDSIDLAIGKGEVCGFLGPNGAGKTTTIGMMMGLIEPTGGRCLIKDMEVMKNPIAIKKITGYLPDGVGFYSNLTAAQNLKFFSKFYGIDDRDANARIAELLSYVGLGDVTKPAGTFSKGMKQRLGLARALLHDPDVLFLDEPTSGLDPEGVVMFRKIIKDQSKKGKSVFFSSHIIDEVEHVCDTVCIISKGKIIARGTVDEVREKMRKEETFTIIVKVKGTIPEINDSRIIEASYNNGSAVIKASSDIRDAIAEELVHNKASICELRLQEESLEEVFINTVYGRN
mgnify:CR=1 FL=1